MASSSNPLTPPVNPNLPHWQELLAREAQTWQHAKRTAAGGMRILVATTTGGGTSSAVAAVESLLGVALTLRGADVHFLLCDQALPACKNLEIVTTTDPREIADGRFPESEFCARCWRDGQSMFGSTTLPVHRLGPLIGAGKRESARGLVATVPDGELAAFRHDGVAVGEHAWAGALRYFARGDLDGEPAGVAVVRRFLEAAVLLVGAFRRLLVQLQPDMVLCSHGIYVPFGIFREIVRGDGRRFETWTVAYRRQCLMFSHGDTYHQTMLDEPVGAWADRPLSAPEESRLMDYLGSRIHGTHDWIWFHEKEQATADDVWHQHGLNDGRPVIGLLTNVIWDAQLHFRGNAYPSMMAWVHATVAYFSTRRDLHLLIRVHPAEVRGTVPSRQTVAAELKRRWPALPENVHVIDAAEPVSTYAVMERCDTALIYGTKMGVELTSMGIPVIVAGEAWIRNKGVACDVGSAAEYHQQLDLLPRRQRLDAAAQDRARRYAHHFFFRRMIPVKALEPATSGWPPFLIRPTTLAAIAPGTDPGLDLITQGILQGTPYIFDEANT